MTLAIVQARFGSERLPRKALLPILGLPLIAHVMRRAHQIQGVDEVVLAVPWADRDALRGAWITMGFADLAESDVLGRFERVLGQYPDCQTVMRLTGDCPLLSAHLAEAVLALYRTRRNCEYAWNVAPGYVDGTDVEVFSAEALRWASRLATDPQDREHVTPWIRRQVTVATLAPRHPSSLKTSVDTLEDYQRVRAMMESA